MDYGWLKEERTFQMDVKEAGFTAREVIAAGENLYDPQFGWLEEDGSITFSDIGGQAEVGEWPNAHFQIHAARARLSDIGDHRLIDVEII